MKKILLIAALLFYGVFINAQAYHTYVRFEKITTAQKLAIDVSDTSVIYEVFDTTLQRKEIYNSTTGSWQPFTHLLASGATDVTSTFGELNLLDLSGLTVDWVLSADSATTASWKAQSVGGTIGGSIIDNQIAVGAATSNEIEGTASFTYDSATSTLDIGVSGIQDEAFFNAGGGNIFKFSDGQATVTFNIGLAVIADSFSATRLIEIIDTTNDGNPLIRMGSGVINDFQAQSFYNVGTSVLDRVDFSTSTTSGTADDGRFNFLVDEVQKLSIDDGGINVSGNIRVLDASDNSTISGVNGEVLVGYIDSSSQYSYGNGNIISLAGGITTLPNTTIAEVATGGAKAVMTSEAVDDRINNINSSLPQSSTIATSRTALLTDLDGINISTSGTDVTITIPLNSSVAFPVNRILQYKRQGTGNVILNYVGGVTGDIIQTYGKNDIVTIWQSAIDTWQPFNPPINHSKLDFLTVTQAVNLDTVESDTNINNAKTGVTTEEANPDLISQAEAEAGTATTERIFSALRVKQAIDALGGGGGTVDVVSNVATNTILGRVTAGSGDSEELTATQVRLLLNVEDGSTADQTASEVAIVDAGALTATTNVEDYLAENRTAIDNLEAGGLQTSSTITTSRDALLTDRDGINITDGSVVTITINSTVTFAAGDILVYQRQGAGDITIAYSGTYTGDTPQTYTDKETISIRYQGSNAWTVINPPINHAKLDFLTVTQAVDLDTVESDTNTNNSKITNANHTGDVTGSGALTISAGAVDIPMLSATGGASSKTVLRGDNTWGSAFSVNTATGTSIDMSATTLNNFSAASSATAFIMTNIAVGGEGAVLINTTSEPTVTDTVDVIAGSFIVGNTYTISAVGTTDFTLIGASASTVGIVFTATGVGSGTGTATTNATKLPNTASWITGTDMILYVKDFNGTRKFYFVEF